MLACGFHCFRLDGRQSSVGSDGRNIWTCTEMETFFVVDILKDSFGQGRTIDVVGLLEALMGSLGRRIMGNANLPSMSDELYMYMWQNVRCLILVCACR